MEKQYLIGIDIGTSAAKVALFSREGGNRPVGVCSAEYPIYYPAPGYVEQNAEDWWGAVCKATKELLAKTGIQPGAIAGVGIDGQSWAAVAIGRDGEVLCPTPIWCDTRSADICRALEQEFGQDRFFNTSLNPLEPGYTFPKLLWYKQNLPEVYRDAVSILQSNGFIAYRLTGNFSHDLSQANGLACFDLRAGKWDLDLCREVGVRTDFLPPLVDSHEIVGRVTPAAAEATGLAVGTPVVAGGLDTACDALGAGVISPGETQEQGGQSGGMSICAASPTADKRLVLCRHVVPGHVLIQGGTVGGGAILRWFHQNFGDQSLGDAGYALADREAEAIAPGADGLILLPYLAGERSPIWDPKAKGVYYGLDYNKTRAHFHRANLEAAAFALRHNLETAADAGAPVGVLRASGGAAKSPLWTQIKADVTGCTVEVPEAFSTAAFGAATLAGVATGVFSSFKEAAAGIRVTRVHTPNPDNREVYDRAYARFRELYETLKPVMHSDGN